MSPEATESRLHEAAAFGLFLPEKIHTLRQIVESGFD